MLKIKDNVDLKELEKYGLKPIYKMTNERTGETKIIGYNSDKYCCKWGYLLFSIGDKPKHKKLSITNRTIHNYELQPYWLEDDNFIDTDLLYDLIKDGLVEKVEE